MSRFSLLCPAHSHHSQDILTIVVLLGLLRYRLRHDGPAVLVQLLGRAIEVGALRPSSLGFSPGKKILIFATHVYIKSTG